MRSCAPHGFTECYINLWLWYTIPLMQLVVGTVGNILSIVVLSRHRMRKHSTTVYLISLAGSDIVTLCVANLPGYLLSFETNVKDHSQFLCKTLRWFSHTGAGFSVYLIALMTLERMFLTILPVLARSKASPRNAVIASVVLLICSASLSIHYVFGVEIRTISTTGTHSNETYVTTSTECMHNDAWGPFYKSVWPLMVLIILNAVPVLIVLVGNATIIVSLLLQKRRLRKTNPCGAPRNLNQHISAYNKRKSSTKTLFVISGFFIVTTLPYSTYRLIQSAHEVGDDPRVEARRELLASVTVLILYCNFTFNFVLYFFGGTMFKQEWGALVKEVKAKFRKVVHSADTDVQDTRDRSKSNVTADRTVEISALQLR